MVFMADAFAVVILIPRSVAVVFVMLVFINVVVFKTAENQCMSTKYIGPVFASPCNSVQKCVNNVSSFTLICVTGNKNIRQK